MLAAPEGGMAPLKGDTPGRAPSGQKHATVKGEGSSSKMPLYMDRHEGVTATPREIALMHLRDLEVQGKYDVRYVTYWIEEEAQRAFCLVDGTPPAPPPA